MSEEKYCPTCEDYRQFVTDSRTETYTVRGQEIPVAVTVEVCTTCNETLFDKARDSEMMQRVYGEYRLLEKLLTPDEIKDIRKRWRLSQRSFAALLGMSEATVNRYEQGALQDRPHDEAIRACRNPDLMKDLLARQGHVLSEGQRRNVEAALATPEDKPHYWDALAKITGRSALLDEVSERTGFRRFDLLRYAAVVRWFCRKLGSIPQTKMNKLLFYSDFQAYRFATVSLTGVPYEHLPYGPVPRGYSELRGRMEAEGLIDVAEVVYANGHMGEEFQVGPTPLEPPVEFTAPELAVLEQVARELGELTPTQISDQSHQEAVYKNTSDRELISYTGADSLSLPSLA